MLSFHGWKILANALHMESNVTLGLLHYRETITSPTSPLLVYTQPLISKDFDFITSLSINVSYPIADLVQLARISNLGILEIIHPRYSEGAAEISPSGVGDLLIRAWSREAKENGAFSVLRILRLWNHTELTGKSLRYFQSFPSLAVLDVNWGIPSGVNVVHEAEDLGWNVIPDNDILEVLDAKCLDRTMSCEASSIMRKEAWSTKPLWDGSKVHRGIRYFTKSSITQSGETHGSGDSKAIKLSLDNSAGALRWPDHVKDAVEEEGQWESLSWELFTKSGPPWEFKNAACWSRIGQLREDKDLIRSGVRGIEEEAFVGPHIVSLVRMAHIRLGELGESGKIWGQTSTKLVSKSLDEQPKFKPYWVSIENSQSVSSDKTGHGKKKARGLERVRPVKKQKLEDVLNGFAGSGPAENCMAASEGP